MWTLLDKDRSEPCTSSLVQVEESLQITCSDTSLFAPLRSSPIAGRSCSPDNVMESCHDSLSGTMSAPLAGESGGDTWTLSAVDSHAKTSRQRARVGVWTVKGRGSGQKWRGLSAKLDLVKHSWKIAPCSQAEDLTSCSWTWPKWGTMLSGVCSGLMMSAHHIDENESGSWPTPTANKMTQSGDLTNPDGTLWDGKQKPHQNGKPVTTALADKVKHIIAGAVKERNLWPTPTTAEVVKIGAQANYGQKGLNNHPRIRGNPTRAKLQKDRKGFDGGIKTPPTYPTPTARDHKSGRGVQQRAYSELTPTIERPHKTGQLNPDWVEWLMAWPIGWTDLKPLAMDRWHSWRQGHTRP
jgi:hypothetical protein